MDGTAVVVTNGHLADMYGKTAHGLIRGSERFKLLAVIDTEYAGRDAGEILDGKPRNIPVYASIEAMLAAVKPKPDYCIIGCATHGGVIPPALRPTLEDAIKAGLNMVNGLHEFLGDDPTFKTLADEADVSIIDVRKPKKPLHFWTGQILSVKAPRIAVLGMDCAIGKRTTARLLCEACNAHGIKALMIYSGQTGWMQGVPHGFLLDAIPNDFVSGELEHAIVSAHRECSPDVIFLEGQSGLRNPSGPCGSEYILSGQARGVILQHAPARRCYSGLEELGCRIPPITEEIELIRLLGAKVLAVTLNGDGLAPGELGAERDRLCEVLDRPVVLPLEEGVDALIPMVSRYIDEETSA
jgi:uncharacterized NAD-dependent epimerase/dehydratase family protein